MFEYLFTGMGFAFAAAIQPGPLQAFLFSKVNQKGWKATLPASLAPIISDGPIALIVLAVLNKLPRDMLGYLQAAGGLLLIYLALSIYLKTKSENLTATETKSGPKTLFQAAAVNILNPNPYLGWSLILGPLVIKAWHTSPSDAIILIIAFYTTMTLTLAVTIIIFGAAKFMNIKWQNRMMIISYVILAAAGIFQLISGILSII